MDGGLQGSNPVFSPAYVAWQKGRVWVVTWISYTCFHLARKIYSIVKDPIQQDMTNDITKTDLGDLDTIFLVSYAVGMFFMGYFADRSNLRVFLGLCMIGAGIACAACGLLKHGETTMGWLSLLYIITGIFQSGGWPSNVAVMGVWFGKSTRGLVMGIWNTHTSVGNILGSLIATAMLGNAKTQYEYHQFDVDIPHTPKESIHTAKMTLKEAEDWCDASSKCVAFTGTGYDGSSAAATWSFTNATASGKHEVAANCTATGPCTFQKDVPWDLSFYVLGAIIFGGGIIILLFLVPHPRDVGLASPDEEDRKAAAASDPESSLNESLMADSGGEDVKISPIRALCIPGVVEFALCFFFAKFVSYTFLFWLPYYLENIGLSKQDAGDLSTAFDYGGMIGGIACGWISDKLGARALVAGVSMTIAIPAMYIYRSTITAGHHPTGMNTFLMVVAGTFINGVYALITTAVSADLGTSPTLKGNGNALAMVTAIIDGTGSLGACITGVAITWLSNKFDTDGCGGGGDGSTGGYDELGADFDASANCNTDPGGWNGVFMVLEICAAMCVVMLTRLMCKEAKELCCGGGADRTNLQYAGR